MALRTVVSIGLVAAIACCLLLRQPYVAAVEVQHFDVNSVDWSVCYGATNVVVPGSLTCTTDLPVPANTSITTYDVLTVAQGSRLTMPTIYTMNTAAVPQNVTMQLDLFCDGVVDTVAGGPSAAPGDPGPTGREGSDQPWPNASIWSPYPFSHLTLPLGSADAYLVDIKRTPSTGAFPFTAPSYDVANPSVVWLGGTIPLRLTAMQSGSRLKLASVVETSPYRPNIKVQQMMLVGDAVPPSNGFLCVDTPERIVWQSSLTTPAAGAYPRWAAMTSDRDPIDGTVARILETHCLIVAPTTDTCDLSDVDGDLVPKAVEDANGTNPSLADTDGDGATDYDEIFQFTDPGCAVGGNICGAGHPADTRDTDGDGFWDKQDDLAGFTSIGPLFGQTNATDNCPVIANPGQENTDSRPDFTNTPNVPEGAIYRGDATNPHQDWLGDACDPDKDGDGLSNAVEMGFQRLNVGPGCTGVGTPPGCTGVGPPVGTSWCQPPGAIVTGGTSTVSTDPLNPDSDSDGGLDGAECQFGSDPTSAASTSCQPNCTGNSRFPDPAVGDDGDGDLLFPDAAEVFYRTQSIALPPPGLGQAHDLEQPGSYAPSGTSIPDLLIGGADPDSDGDLILDGIEVKFYGTSPANFDTDGDGCSDGREIADVNGDHKVNSTDLSAVSQHNTSNGPLKPGGTAPPPLGAPSALYSVNGVRRDEVANYDLNKDGRIDSNDLLLVARLTGNCLSGTGAQTARAIIRQAK